MVRPEPTSPQVRIARANKAARLEPKDADYLNAIQVYPYSEGALYQVYAAPGEITDIALEPCEQLVGTGPVAAGDTVRWIIGDTESGSGATKRIHILIKPTRAKLTTNLVINTDRRTYHLELRATETTYMASVSWTYPQDQLIALRKANAVAEASAPVASGIDLSASVIASMATHRLGGPFAPSMMAGRCLSNFRAGLSKARCRLCGCWVRTVVRNWSITASRAAS
jgi:type IV secretion system protein VirB9